MSAWSKEPTEYVGELKKRLEEQILDLAKRVFDGIVIRTPVLTGSLRASWRAAVGAMDPSITVGKSTTNPLPAPSFGLTQFKLGEVLYISNSQPYATIIEYGSYSKKAPQGMVRVTLASIGGVSVV